MQSRAKKTKKFSFHPVRILAIVRDFLPAAKTKAFFVVFQGA